MSDVVIKPRAVINVKIGEASYPCRKPTLGRAAQFEDDINEAKPKSSKAVCEVMYSFLEEIGLPREVTVDFDTDQLEQVIDIFRSKKKP